jgi:hypothetical protein
MISMVFRTHICAQSRNTLKDCSFQVFQVELGGGFEPPTEPLYRQSLKPLNQPGARIKNIELVYM